MPDSQSNRGETSAYVYGMCGVLADEVSQNLILVLEKAAQACLLMLKDLSLKQERAGVDPNGLFRAGLQSIYKWDAEVLKGEVSKIEAIHSQILTFYQYFLKVLQKHLSPVLPAFTTTPSFTTFFHLFMCHVCSNSEVLLKGVGFFDATLLERRQIFVDSFRRASYDVAEQCGVRNGVEVRSTPFPAEAEERRKFEADAEERGDRRKSDAESEERRRKRKERSLPSIQEEEDAKEDSRRHRSSETRANSSDDSVLEEIPQKRSSSERSSQSGREEKSIVLRVRRDSEPEERRSDASA
jgi:flagellar biosynthesis GTPase FlhF